MERNSFLSRSWGQVIFGIVKIMLCINVPIAIGTAILPKLNGVINNGVKFPTNMDVIQIICVNILLSAMAFDVFFFWEGIRAKFKIWFPKTIKNLVVSAAAFLVSIILIYVTWDKAVIGFSFLSPKISLTDAFWLAAPIRTVVGLYKLIVGGLSSIKNGDDREFESGKDKPKYRRHPSHIPPQIRSEQPHY